LSACLATVLHMKISESEDYWRLVTAHTNARNSDGAPWPVQLQVAALVGDHTIVASVARFSPETPSTWMITVVTDDGRLVRVRMEFDAERYDLDSEQRTHRLHDSVASTVHEAWVRRLSDVVRLEVRKAQRRLSGFGSPSRSEFDFGDVHLKFHDGAEVDLGIDQLAMRDDDERTYADAFLDALRAHAGL
jgi:hypothetical protein